MKNRIECIKNEVLTGVTAIFGEKLFRLVLYGSYARGDFDNESDIDIDFMAIVDVPRISLYHAQIIDLSDKLSMKYDIVVSIKTVEKQLFLERIGYYPFYRNIRAEGVDLLVG